MKKLHEFINCKKLFLMLAISLASVSGFAQSQEYSSIEEVTSSIKRDMLNWKKPKILHNQKQSDNEILNKILENINNFNSASSLRRHFRHNLNIACEEKRFLKLYNNAKDIMNESTKN